MISKPKGTNKPDAVTKLQSQWVKDVSLVETCPKHKTAATGPGASGEALVEGLADALFILDVGRLVLNAVGEGGAESHGERIELDVVGQVGGSDGEALGRSVPHLEFVGSTGVSQQIKAGTNWEA